MHFFFFSFIVFWTFFFNSRFSFGVYGSRFLLYFVQLKSQVFNDPDLFVVVIDIDDQ